MSNCQSCVHFSTRQGGVGGDLFDHSQGQGARVAGRVLLLSPQRCVSAFVLLPLIFCLRSCLHHLVSIREGPRALCQTSFRGAAECRTIRWRWRRSGGSSTWPSPEPRSVGDLVAMALGLLPALSAVVCPCGYHSDDFPFCAARQVVLAFSYNRSDGGVECPFLQNVASKFVVHVDPPTNTRTAARR